MTDIFREVDEALQQEKAARLWKEYGPTLVIAAFVLIAATGATTAFRAWSEGRNKDATGQLVAAMEQDKTAPDTLEKLSGELKGNHKTIALMNAAGKHAAEKDFGKAASLYEQVASDSGAAQELRDLAAILSLRAQQMTPDSKNYKGWIEKLKPVAENKSSAFQLQAKLDAALLYGSGLKDYNAALKTLEGFDGEEVPASLKEKADALKRIYTYETAKPETANGTEQKK
jgi:hypothetical protein